MLEFLGIPGIPKFRFFLRPEFQEFQPGITHVWSENEITSDGSDFSI